jgi:hypothetical protein
MPISDLTNEAFDFGGTLGQQLAGPFGPLLGLQQKSFPSSYPLIKRFVQDSAQLRSANGVTDLDDPTYLGFSLSFDITSPLFNDGFPANPDDTLYSGSPSASAYLSVLGEQTRAAYLKAFIQGLLKINSERPYYWQSIDGLSDAWTKNTELGDPYVGTKDTEGITIGCLEAIDLKLTALFSLYRMAVYDAKYRRYIVPNNLLRFNVTINVQEIRKFKTVRNWLNALNLSTKRQYTLDYINENTSQVSFTLTDCMWIPGESGKVFDNVSNSEINVSSTSIKFSYSNIVESSQFSGYDGKLDQKSKLIDPPQAKLGDKIKNFAKDQLANQANGAINKGLRAANSFLQGLTLGNVYGGRNTLFGAISNPQALINAAIGAAVQEETTFGNSFGFRVGENLFPANPIVPGGRLAANRSAFDPVTPPQNSLPQQGRIQPPALRPTNNDGLNPPTFNSNNLFGSSPSGPPPLTSSNIFD